MERLLTDLQEKQFSAFLNELGKMNALPVKLDMPSMHKWLEQFTAVQFITTGAIPNINLADSTLRAWERLNYGKAIT